MTNLLVNKKFITNFRLLANCFRGDTDGLMKACSGFPMKYKKLGSTKYNKVPKGHKFKLQNFYMVDPNIIYVNELGQVFYEEEIAYYWSFEDRKVCKYRVPAKEPNFMELGPCAGMTGIYKTREEAIIGIKLAIDLDIYEDY